MDIEIPDEVTFFFVHYPRRDGIGKRHSLCFMHAVKRAMEGEKVEVELTTWAGGCDTCLDLKNPV